jgi:bacteriocin-like protein
MTEIRDDELDQINGGRGIEVIVKHSFNTGGTEVGNVSIHAYKAGVQVAIGSSGGIYVSL